MADIGVTMEECILAAKPFGFTAKEMAEGVRRLVNALPTCKQFAESFYIKE